MIDSSSVFLVSGGAKGITAECIIRLAQRYPCKLILLGRSAFNPVEPDWARDCVEESELKKRIMQDFIARGEKPTPMAVQKVYKQLLSQREIAKTLLALQQAGARAEYISADVTDAPALEEKLRTTVGRMGAITGIIHGAGNLADKRIEKKTERDFETVYAAKVQGLENLLRCIRPNQLEHLVLFSSVAGFYGNAGQTDYAIANEILNKSAHLVKQFHPNCRVVSINWGPWDSGMVTPELKRAFAQRNIEVIPLDVGAHMLIAELARRDAAQVVIGSPITPQPETLTPELKTYRIRRRLGLNANPFLWDHQIGEHCVLPAACAASWFARTCEQLYPGYTFFSLENFKVLKGIIFDKVRVCELVLDVKEVAKIDSERVIFETNLWSEADSGKLFFHYSARVTIGSTIPAIPIYHTFKRDREQFAAATSFYRDGTLFHGSCFQGIESVLNFSAQKLTLQCIAPPLDERQQGQFPIDPLNPYIADTLIQAILIWNQHFHQAGSLPSEIKKIEQFRPLQFNEKYYISVDVKSSTEINTIADVTAHDSQGEIFLRLSEAKVMLNKQLNPLFTKKSMARKG
jgi:NAD(P)-dependent dehydrogenase (short-subunit alcohol dehydrogenase family)